MSLTDLCKFKMLHNLQTRIVSLLVDPPNTTLYSTSCYIVLSAESSCTFNISNILLSPLTRSFVGMAIHQKKICCDASVSLLDESLYYRLAWIHICAHNASSERQGSSSSCLLLKESVIPEKSLNADISQQYSPVVQIINSNRRPFSQ